jgi:hypothetical protein
MARVENVKDYPGIKEDASAADTLRECINLNKVFHVIKIENGDIRISYNERESAPPFPSKTRAGTAIVGRVRCYMKRWLIEDEFKLLVEYLNIFKAAIILHFAVVMNHEYNPDVYKSLAYLWKQVPDAVQLNYGTIYIGWADEMTFIETTESYGALDTTQLLLALHSEQELKTVHGTKIHVRITECNYATLFNLFTFKLNMIEVEPMIVPDGSFYFLWKELNPEETVYDDDNPPMWLEAKAIQLNTDEAAMQFAFTLERIVDSRPDLKLARVKLKDPTNGAAAPFVGFVRDRVREKIIKGQRNYYYSCQPQLRLEPRVRGTGGWFSSLRYETDLEHRLRSISLNQMMAFLIPVYHPFRQNPNSYIRMLNDDVLSVIKDMLFERPNQ